MLRVAVAWASPEARHVLLTTPIHSSLVRAAFWLAIGLLITILNAEYCSLWSRTRLATLDHFAHDRSSGWLKLAPNPKSAPIGIPQPASDRHASDRRARLQELADRGWMDGFLKMPTTTATVTTHLGRGILVESLSLSQGFALDAAEVTVISAGWPFKCAQARRWMDHSVWKPNVTPQWAGALAAPKVLRPQPRYFGPAQLVLAPIWPGLLANTAIWMSLVGGLHLAVIGVRRSRRVHRALCTRCAYPVRGLARCPECGSPTPA